MLHAAELEDRLKIGLRRVFSPEINLLGQSQLSQRLPGF
jgi:hypothetical protein